jgi:hypothetical protein
VGLRKEGEREVTARRGGRATGVHASAARRSNDVTVAVALHGGNAEDVCPYAVGTGELDSNGERAGHTAGERVPAHGAYSARRARGKATQRPRWCAFDRGSLASRAGCTRASSPSGWHRNPAGAATTAAVQRAAAM